MRGVGGCECGARAWWRTAGPRAHLLSAHGEHVARVVGIAHGVGDGLPEPRANAHGAAERERRWRVPPGSNCARVVKIAGPSADSPRDLIATWPLHTKKAIPHEILPEIPRHSTKKSEKMSRPGATLHRKSRNVPRHGGVRNGSPFRRGAAGCRWKCGFHTADTTPDQGSAEHLGLCRYRDSGLSTRVFHHTKPTFLMKLSPKYSDPCWVERKVSLSRRSLSSIGTLAAPVEG